MLHASRQVGFRVLQKQMDVMGHPTKGKHFPSRPSDFFLESRRPAIVMAVIMKERAASIAPRDSDRPHQEIESSYPTAKRSRYVNEKDGLQKHQQIALVTTSNAVNSVAIVTYKGPQLCSSHGLELPNSPNIQPG